MKTPVYAYLILAIILVSASVFVFYNFLMEKQKSVEIEKQQKIYVKKADPTKNLPKPYVDENDTTPTKFVQKVDLAPITPISKELEQAIIKTEKDMDTSDGKETKLFE